MEQETFDVLTKFQSFGLLVGGGGTSHKRIKCNVTCSEPEFLCWGGGGVVQGRLLENSLNNVFFSFSSAYFIVYKGGQIVYQWFLFQRKLLFPCFRGSSIINPGWSTIFHEVQLFPGWGIQMLFSIETHITCKISGGRGRTPPEILQVIWGTPLPIWIHA